MAGLSAMAINTTPILGGVLLAPLRGKWEVRTNERNKSGPRSAGAPACDQVTRRAAILRTVELRIDDLVSAAEKSRQMKAAATSYQGNWRDIFLFVSAVSFTFIWWHVNHNRTDWLPMFIVMIAVCVLSAVFAFRGSVSSARGSSAPPQPSTNRFSRLTAQQQSYIVHCRTEIASVRRTVRSTRFKKRSRRVRDHHDWTKPAAMAIPKEGYFELERGRTDRFSAHSGLLRLLDNRQVKEGRVDAIREHGKVIEAAIAKTPKS